MKARIIEQPAKVYSDANISSPSITELSIGSEIEIGGIKKKNGQSFVTVNLADGKKGYMLGNTHVFIIKQATLRQEKANVYAEPSAGSVLTTSIQKNSQFYLTDVVKQDNKSWVKIREISGREGFIEGQTKIKVIQEKAKPTKYNGRRNMLFGALWCIGGTVVTVATYSAASSGGGGRYVIAWGAILFGAVQFFQGLFQYLNATD